MPYKYRQLIMVIVIEFTVVVMLDRLGYSSIVMPYLIFVGLFLILLPASFGKIRYRTDRVNLAIPAKFQTYHNELLALGFELDCLLFMTNYFMPIKQWVYRHKLERVEAYINEEMGLLWFSSYFEKNFDISTRFRDGIVVENKKMVSHLVKTSIPAAFEYHLQHRQKYLGQYGDILLFDTTEQQIEWELKQNLAKEFKREEFKILGRLLLAAFVLFVMLIVLAIFVLGYFQYAMPEKAKELGELWANWFLLLGSIVGIAWTYWPVLFPKTVEDRKGKKELV